MTKATAFLRMTLLVAVVVLLSALIDSSTACQRTFDKDTQWACWNMNAIGSTYNKNAINRCCSGYTCECDETDRYNNPRFGKDCKCVPRDG